MIIFGLTQFGINDTW